MYTVLFITRREFNMDMDENHSIHSIKIETEVRKRLRCSNFSSQEKNVLIHIIEKYHDVVECKKTDKGSVQEREKVWEVITREFNDTLLIEPNRTCKQLKMCYDNLKRKIRREVGVDEPKTQQTNSLEPILMRNQVMLISDVESNSSIHIQNSQGSSGVNSEPKSPFFSNASENTFSAETFNEPTRKSANIAKLKRILLNKEIRLVNLDLEMRAKKYELELKVQEAKLEYYRRRIASLDGSSSED